MTPDDDPVLFFYLHSETFKRRAAALQARIIAEVEAGKTPPTLEDIARELQVPLDVVEGGLRHSLAKHLLREAPVENGAAN